MATATIALRLTLTSVARDFLSLTKPRVVLLHLLTAASAMVLASGGLPPGYTLLFTLAGGGLVACASNALNCFFDRDLDGMMSRTRRRPLPAGRLSPGQSIAFAVATAFAGLLMLISLVSVATAMLALGALVYYVVIYTVWLKRSTRWSAAFASGAGAFPPLIGWMAITGGIGLAPILLFAIISLWTPPHFWALTILRRSEYEQAGIKVLPTRDASLWIIVCVLLLVSTTLLLVPVAGMGWLYLGMALALGLVFLCLAARLRVSQASTSARRLYLYSILYLLLLFGLMAIDRLGMFTARVFG